jgi:voltage-gated potassium channel Kch
VGSLLTASLLSLILAGTTWADVKYESKTELKFPGKLGTFMGAMEKLGGAQTKYTEIVYVKGDKMRTDEDDESTIIDLEGKRIISLDHKKKTYTILSLEEMRQRMKQMMEEMAEAQEEGQEEAAMEPAEEEAPTTEVNFDLSVDRTGEKKKINGYRAERVILTVTAEATNVAPEESEEQGVEGTLVTVTELWLSKEVKGYDEAEAFQKRMAEVMGEAMFGGSTIDSWQSALQSDPRMKAALEKAGDEMTKLEGVPVLSTTYMVIVPAGLEFQQSLVFEKKKKKKRGFGGLAGFAKKAMKSKLGAEEGEGEEKEAEPLKQSTILTITTALQKISTKKLSDSLFEIPSEYREIGL